MSAFVQGRAIRAFSVKVKATLASLFRLWESSTKRRKEARRKLCRMFAHSIARPLQQAFVLWKISNEKRKWKGRNVSLLKELSALKNQLHEQNSTMIDYKASSVSFALGRQRRSQQHHIWSAWIKFVVHRRFAKASLRLVLRHRLYDRIHILSQVWASWTTGCPLRKGRRALFLRSLRFVKWKVKRQENRRVLLIAAVLLLAKRVYYQKQNIAFIVWRSCILSTQNDSPFVNTVNALSPISTHIPKSQNFYNQQNSRDSFTQNEYITTPYRNTRGGLTPGITSSRRRRDVGLVHMPTATEKRTQMGMIVTRTPVAIDNQRSSYSNTPKAYAKAYKRVVFTPMR